MKHFSKLLLDMIAPQSGLYSFNSQYGVHPDTLKLSHEYYSNQHSLTEGLLEGVYATFTYDTVIKHLLQRIKLHKEWSLAYELADHMWQRLWVDSAYFLPNPDAIVPVPPDPKRFHIRGFHVPNILAQQLSLFLDKAGYSAPSFQILSKSRHSSPQSELSRVERLQSLQGVFEITLAPKFHTFEHIWLVDDVTTTGATLRECAQTILSVYPHLKVYGVTAAVRHIQPE